MFSWQIVDKYLGEVKAKKQTTFTAWQFDQWLQANHPAWYGQASQMLQMHKWIQGQYRTKHRCFCTRRGPDAPWAIEYDGSWMRSLTIKTQQLFFKDAFTDYACRALPMARAEDARHGHAKAKAADADGPQLALCKQLITNLGFSVNAVLVQLGLAPVDVPKLLARY